MVTIITRPDEDPPERIRRHMTEEDHARDQFLDQIRELPALYAYRPPAKAIDQNQTYTREELEKAKVEYHAKGFKTGVEAVLDHIDNEGYNLFYSSYNINADRHTNMACGIWYDTVNS